MPGFDPGPQCISISLASNTVPTKLSRMSQPVPKIIQSLCTLATHLQSATVIYFIESSLSTSIPHVFSAQCLTKWRVNTCKMKYGLTDIDRGRPMVKDRTRARLEWRAISVKYVACRIFHSYNVFIVKPQLPSVFLSNRPLFACNFDSAPQPANTWKLILLLPFSFSPNSLC